MKIHAKIVVVVISVSLIVNSIFITGFIKYKKNQSLRNLHKQIVNIKSFIQEMNSYALHKGDVVQLKNNTRTLLNIPEIISISLSSNNHKINIKYSNTGYDNDTLLKTDSTIEYKNKIIGYTEVIYTTRYIDEKLSKTILEMVVVVLLITLTLSLLIYFVIKRITSPISELTNLSTDIANGNLNRVISFRSNNEIGNLAHSLDQMRNSIKEKIRNLSNENEERKKAENILQKRTQELAVANSKLEHKKELLEDLVTERTEELKNSVNRLVESEKMASLGTLVAGVAHEINTPVGITVTASSHLEDRTKEFREHYNSGKFSRKEFEHYLDDAATCSKLIFTNSKRAATLINSFKKVAVDQSCGEIREFEISSYINELLISLQPKFKKTDFEIEVVCPEDLAVKTYPGALSQILTNLLLNSLIHGFEEIREGNITIIVEETNSNILLTYKDSGHGIDEKTLSRIFDPFYTTKRGSGGSGLGLNIVYNLVSQTLNGSIRCSSNLGQGTTFELLFPSRIDINELNTVNS